MITRKGFIRLLIIVMLFSAPIISLHIPIVHAPAPFTAVETLDLYDCINRGTVSVINGSDLYIGTIDDYAGAKIAKIDLNTFTQTANITLPQNEDDIYDMIISGDYLYAAHSNYPAQITKINLTTFERVDVLTFESGEYGARDQVVVGSNLYVLLNTPPAKIVKVDLTSFTRVGVLNLSAANKEYYGTRLLYEGSGDMIYAVTQSPFDSPIYEALRVVKINVTSFSRVAAINFNNGIECYGYAASVTGGYLYVATVYSVGMTYSRVVKINLSSFTRVATIDFPSPLNYARSYDMATDGTYLYIKMGTAVHYLHRVEISSFTWYGSAISYIQAAKNSLSISGGYLYSPNLGTWTTVYKVDLSSFAIDDTLPLYVGITADRIRHMETDENFLYALLYMSPSGISKINLASFSLVTTQKFNSGEKDAEGFELYNNYLYVGVDNSTGSKVLKVDTSTLATVDELVLGAGNYTILSLHVAEDGYLYAGVATWNDEGKVYKLDPSNLDIISTMTLDTDETEPYDMASDGTYLYVVIETDYYLTQIPKIALADFSRVDYITLQGDRDQPRTCSYSNGYLYVTGYSSPTIVSKIDVETMTEVDYEVLPAAEEYAEDTVILGGNLYVGLDYPSGGEGGRISKLELSTLDRVDVVELNWTNKERDVGSLALGEVGSDVFLFAGIYQSAMGKIVKIYLTSSVDVTFASSPEIAATFTVDGTEYTTPDSLSLYLGVHTLVATAEIEYDEITYVFTSWLVNGTTYYYTLQHSPDLAGETSFVLNYELKGNPPVIPPLYDPTDPNMTLYMRSDTHTIQDDLGYKLMIQQSTTSIFDVRSIGANTSISYGSRVWIIDSSGNVFELTSGTPVATVTRDDNSSSLMSSTWTSGDFSNYITDILMVKIYQRFGTDDWTLRRTFLSNEELLIRLPSSTWTFYYYVDHYINGVTNSTFYHGSATYNSRITFFYAAISPWEMMTYHYIEFNFLTALFIPWTFHIGDMFWGIILMFILVTTYNRYGSLRAVLAMSWLFAGSGGILSFVIPQVGLEISWIFLAFTLAITLYKLIR